MRQKIIPILIILFGFALLSYPFISNYMFEKSAGSTIKSYEKQAKTYDQKQKEQAFRKAEEYNKDLIKSVVQLTDPFKVKKSNGETLIYNNILNIDHSGVMGYLEIPCISVNLPIYHGTDAEILERGVGHLAASSIPEQMLWGAWGGRFSLFVCFMPQQRRGGRIRPGSRDTFPRCAWKRSGHTSPHFSAGTG